MRDRNPARATQSYVYSTRPIDDCLTILEIIGRHHRAWWQLKYSTPVTDSDRSKLSDLSYIHDPDGNVGSIDDHVTPARSAIYGYDAMGRMNMMVAEGSASTASYSHHHRHQPPFQHHHACRHAQHPI